MNELMRGFAAPVSRARATDSLTISAVSIGIDRSPGDDKVAISLRHADGTMLTGYLDGYGLERLGRFLREATAAPADAAPMVLVR